MKILNELRTAKGFTTFVALTFEVDLPWFESLLLRQLRRRGVRRFILFVDHSKLSQALKEQGHRLIGSGRSYMLQPVKLSGNFHPKMLLLSGEKSARLYVGSGNLTRGGLDRNLEVFERWDVSVDDEFVPPAFSSVKSYVSQLLDESVGFAPPLALRIVDHAFASPALSKTPVPSPSTEIWGSPGSLIVRIEPQATAGGTLRIVSPYFDEKGSMAVEIASRLGVSSFEILTDLRKTDLTPEAVMTIKKANGRVRKIDPSKHRRPLHAKLFYASSNGRALGVSGSANATNAAWHGHNGELIVVRKDEEADALAGLINGLVTKDLTSADLKQLERLAAIKASRHAEEEEHQQPVGPRILYAEWKSLSKVRLIVTPGEWKAKAVEFAGIPELTGEFLGSSETDEGHLHFEVGCPVSIHRDRVTVLRLVGKYEASDWAVVHDPEEIQAQASPGAPHRQKLEELLGNEKFDPDGATRLLELFSKILRERIDKKPKLPPQKVISENDEVTSAENDYKPEWRTVSEDDFMKSAQKRTPELQQSYFAGMLTSRLMNRLLFGDDEVVETIDTEGESELDEDSADNERDLKGGMEGNDTFATEEEPTGKQRKSFLDAAEDARENYVRHLQLEEYEDRSPYRLLDDLQVLTAPLHYMYRGNGMGAASFRTAMVLLLRAFLGNSDAPFTRALSEMPNDMRNEFWIRTPTLLLVNLLVYNTCLADLEANPFQRVTSDFLHALPVLWLRHLIRTVPSELLEHVEEIAEQSLPRLKCGAFWIAEKLSPWAKKAPFHKFIKNMVSGARAIDRVDQEFDKSFATLVGRKDVVGLIDEDEPIVLRKWVGSIGVGWVEGEQALAHVGAFQFPEASEHQERMTYDNLEKAVPLKVLEHHSSTLGDDLKEGISLLRRIAGP